ncbi:MAG: DNA repair protein RadC [Kiritimatiellae bacterium]|nr:DNA repair protein RadC [Kiritimatiellia bacterium]
MKEKVPTKRKIASVHEGHRERVRQRFHKEGLDAFADHEVLEFALFYVFPRGDTNVTAHRLLERFGSLAGVLDATPADLSSVVGIGGNAAAFINFIPQLARRYLMDRVTTERTLLKNSEDAMRYAISLMAGRAEEVFFVVSLDAVCRLVHAVLLAQGTVSEVRLHPRQVVEVALRNRASSVLFIHNHPAGTAKPSTDDLRLTETLVNAFQPLSIKVVDHIIVAGNQAYSFARENMMPKG